MPPASGRAPPKIRSRVNSGEICYAGAVSVDSPPVAELAGLLAEVFSSDELRRFVAGLPEGPNLLRELSEGAVPAAKLAHEVAELLDRHDLTRTERLWSALLADRPRRTEAIERLRRRFVPVKADLPEFPGYKVLDQVGGGSSGTVWRVRELHTGVERAIKQAHPDGGRVVRNRLVREYKLLARLSHPALLRVHHMVFEADRAWMVCEHLSGGTLLDRIQRRERWTDVELAWLGATLAGALALLHDQTPHVMHRDLRPKNIVFDDRGQPHLIDLGHAKETEEPVDETGTRGPASAYLAPELTGLRPQAASPQSDQYSLCSVLLHAALVDIAEDWPENSEDVRVMLTGRSPALVEILVRGRARRPEHRFEKTAMLEAALRGILETAEEARRREAEEARAAETAGLRTAEARATAELERARQELSEARAWLDRVNENLDRQRKARAEAVRDGRDASAQAQKALEDLGQERAARGAAEEMARQEHAQAQKALSDLKQERGARARADAAARESDEKWRRLDTDLKRERELRVRAEAAGAEGKATLEERQRALAEVETTLSGERAARRKVELGARGRSLAAGGLGVLLGGLGGALMALGLASLRPDPVAEAPTCPELACPEPPAVVTSSITGTPTAPAIPPALSAPLGAVGAPAIGGPTGRILTGRVGAAELRFVELSAGEFDMGSPDGEGDSDEHPRHRVRLTRPLWVAESELTQAQWAAVVKAAQAAGDPEAKDLSEDPSAHKGAKLPVEQVSWCQSVRFANALSRLEGLKAAYTVGADCETGGEVVWARDADGYRLPTEAEWEYAARAGTTTRYATGDLEADMARAGWSSGNSGDQSHEVCTAPERPWGLCDLHGNVCEWIWDRYAADTYGKSPPEDPASAASGGARAIRGGSFFNGPNWARSAFRFFWVPSFLYRDLGFRLVRPAPQP